MIEVPEKDRDTTQRGRTSGPLGWNSVERVSVSGSFASECLGFATEANSQVYDGIEPLSTEPGTQTAMLLQVSLGIPECLHGHGRPRPAVIV